MRERTNTEELADLAYDMVPRGYLEAELERVSGLMLIALATAGPILLGGILGILL